MGINTNDVGDIDTGTNGLLNHPVILNVVQTGITTYSVTYALDVPVGNYRVEFFANPSGTSGSYMGEGEIYVTADSFISTGTIATKTITITSTNGGAFTATATEDLGGGNYGSTSEFSNSYPFGIDLGSASGTQTALLDNGAYHIINGSYMGGCVSADIPGVTPDQNLPGNTYPAKGTMPCNNDHDGVHFYGEAPTIGVVPGSVGSGSYVPSGSGEINDAVFSGAYTGSGDCASILTFVNSTAPGNGDTVDHFGWSFYGTGSCGFNPTMDIPITPGVPQVLGQGVSVTFTSGTGHSVINFGGPSSYWFAVVVPPTTGGTVSGDSLTSPIFTPGKVFGAKITTSTPGYLSAWEDNNGDGDFSDAGEQFITNQLVGAGDNTISITAPMALGSHNIRFRFTSDSAPGMLPIGEAIGGEVEDYTITVAKPKGSRSGSKPTLQNSSNQNPSNNTGGVTTPIATNLSQACPVFYGYYKKGDKNPEIKKFKNSSMMNWVPLSICQDSMEIKHLML
jgi:hypothetical protein